MWFSRNREREKNDKRNRCIEEKIDNLTRSRQWFVNVNERENVWMKKAILCLCNRERDITADKLKLNNTETENKEKRGRDDNRQVKTKQHRNRKEIKTISKW